MQLLTLLFVTVALFSVGNCSCDDIDPTDSSSQSSNVCYGILQSLESALFEDKGNLYRLRKAFFYAPNADLVLLKVKYNITFAENITEEELSYCTSEDNTTLLTTLNQTEIIHGWTSRGLYMWIEPLCLNRMQMALPFDMLRLIHKFAYKNGNSEMDSFLWDGSWDLYTLHINLHIDFLPCIPSDKTFNSTIEELTTLVSYHACTSLGLS